MAKQKKVISVIFLLPLFLLALSLSLLLLSKSLQILYVKDELICPSVQGSHPKPGSLLSLKEETLPTVMKNDQTQSLRVSSKLSRRMRVLRPSVKNSSEFVKRITEFFNESSANLRDTTSACSLRFFMTWISPLKDFGPRELLAIESLFKSHPKASLLIMSSTMDSSRGNRVLKPFLNNGFRVTTISPDFAYLVKGTPVEAWYSRLLNGQVDTGEVSLGQNLSNLLRLLVLYKYGGIYVDTDVIVMRSFIGLKNCIGAQAEDIATHKWSRLNNAVMIFDKNHPILLEFIREFASTFDGNKWGHNGPYLVSRVVSRFESKSESDYNVSVLPPVAFYPVDWSRIGGLFHKPTSEFHAKWMRGKLEWIRRGSFALHLWNRESRGMKVEKGSIIARIISDRCLFCNFSVQGS